MNHELFISYRKSDEAGFSGRIYDRLSSRFGPQEVFMDVEGLSPGVDYVKVIFDAVDNSEVVLALIGKDWLTVADENGKRRLEKEDDWVRVEIESGFALGKVVIPVLMGNAQPVRKDQLPQLMQPLADRQFVRVSHEAFNDDVSRLISAIENTIADRKALRERERAALERQAAGIEAIRPLNRIEIDKRHLECILPAKFVRVVPKLDRFPNELGRERGPFGKESLFVHVGDHLEYRGRFLKDILRDMYGYSGGATGKGDEQEWIAFKWRMKPEDWAHFQCGPATIEAAFHLLTKFARLPLSQSSPIDRQRQALAELVQLRLFSDPLIEIGRFVRGQDIDRADSSPVELRSIGFKAIADRFGVNATAPHNGRGRSEYSARHFFFSNRDLNSMDFEVQQLKTPDDLVLLT